VAGMDEFLSTLAFGHHEVAYGVDRNSPPSSSANIRFDELRASTSTQLTQ
jgi:hypothetical protein